MESSSIDIYLNNIRDKNDENRINYDKLISECPYITNSKDLDKLKDILSELKEENKDFYDYIISILKTNFDLETLFSLYKEYKEAKLREEVLDKEIKAKDREFEDINLELDDREYILKRVDSDAKKLKDMGKIISNLSEIASINLEDTFNKFEKEEAVRLGFGTKALLALGSFLAFKNNRNIIGALLTSYLSYKVLGELVSGKKNNYVDLCNDYIDTLEDYKSDVLDIEKDLVNNLNNIDNLEALLKKKYKQYLKESEFKRIFKMIDDIKTIINRSLKDIDKTKDNINRSIDDGKTKVKIMES